ncbi:MAG: orotidine-5'-phosphate decarboxylase [Pseudomonadota bacterium]
MLLKIEYDGATLFGYRMAATFYSKLQASWHRQNSLVCVGLDPDLNRLPLHLQDDETPYFTFCREIVDATAPYVAAFKPQFAHFAALAKEGELAQLTRYIRDHYPDHVCILDAKRGDIGSTAEFYALEAYERYAADAVTVSPYLGRDSIDPYLNYPDRGVVVLCRTSNPASDWLQNRSQDDDPVYAHVARSVASWDSGQFMLVCGATYPAELSEIRDLVDHIPLLVPGIGAQGGDLRAVLEHGLDRHGTGLLISSSRNIIFAGDGGDFAEAAANAAAALRDEINILKG